MPFPLLLSAVLLTLFLLALYVARRLKQLGLLGKRKRWFFSLVMLAGPFLLVIGKLRHLGGASISEPLSLGLALLGSAITLGWIFAAFFLMHVDIVRWVARKFRRNRDQGTQNDALEQVALEQVALEQVALELSAEPFISSTNEEEPRLFSRREAMAVGAAIVAGPTVSTYASVVGRHDYDLTETTIRLERLPRTLDGLSIIQLSDLHIGAFVGEWETNAALDLVRAARGDLIVLTGDLLDHEAAYAPELGRFIRRLSSLSRYGVHVVPGNHDYYAGIDEVLTAAAEGGGRVLRNAGVEIGDDGGRIALLGVDDLWSTRFGSGPNLDHALADVSPDLARVLLCHQPEFFHENAGSVHLQLSGHTHGGQIALGYNPASLVLPHGYVRGRYERHGGQLYVNRGFGTAGPVARLGSAPEISKIILTV